MAAVRSVGALSLVDPAALVQMGVAVRGWAETAEDLSRQATTLTKRLADELQSDVRERNKKVNDLEEELRRARGEARQTIASELRTAKDALENCRRALRTANDMQRSAQVLGRRISESRGSRVPRAEADLSRRMNALAGYSAHPVAHLAGMVVRAFGSQLMDDASAASDQLTANMPDRIGGLASAGLVLGNEVRTTLYSTTPEMWALKIHGIFHPK